MIGLRAAKGLGDAVHLRAGALQFLALGQKADAMPNADYISDHALMIGNHSQPIDWNILDGVAA